ncbi:hypothetical protein EVAR_99526_1 [Eumeta japonica]|uniref:Uncharacterized protein n=1 Tax=Eumeta variegata TaxID=151549 RepID=A0A4C2AE11_EUMVA|nr:hypothetical protein EVAR_99526_1 [Eumeta japonica]
MNYQKAKRCSSERCTPSHNECSEVHEPAIIFSRSNVTVSTNGSCSIIHYLTRRRGIVHGALRPDTFTAVTMESKRLKDFFTERGHLDLLREFEVYCSYSTSPDQLNPTWTPKWRRKRIQVPKRKPASHGFATYGPAYIRLFGKIPGVNSASQSPPLPARSPPRVAGHHTIGQRDLFDFLAHHWEV